MSSFESVLSWSPREDVAVLVLCLCTVVLMLVIFGVWCRIYDAESVKIRRDSVDFPSTRETPSSWSTWTVTSWDIEVRDSEGKLLHKEGPFYSWDKAFARCAELNAKHS